MCGIFCYKGAGESTTKLITGLKALDYRGYDSWGAYSKGTKTIFKKRVGNEIRLEEDNSRLFLSHCLHPDTLIQTSSGNILKISELQNEKLKTMNKNMKFISSEMKVFKHKQKSKFYHLKTPSFEIKCTSKHKMFVFENCEIIEKKVEDVKKNDLIVCAKNVKICGNNKKLLNVKFKKYYTISNNGIKIINNTIKNSGLTKKEICNKSGVTYAWLKHILSRDRNAEERNLLSILNVLKINFDNNFTSIHKYQEWDLKLPTKTDKDVLEIFGYFVGDGYAGKRSLKVTDTDIFTLNHYKKLFKKVFNVKGKIIPLKNTIASNFEVNNAALCKWLNINAKGDIGFPKNVGELTEKEITGFLKGLYTAEGCVGRGSNQIKIVMVNKRLIKTVQMLLLRIGIIASYNFEKSTNKNWNDKHGLYISNYNDIKKFQSKIGFVQKYKTEKMATILNKMKSGLNVSVKYIPFKKSKLQNGGGSGFITQIGYKNNKYIKPEMKSEINKYLESDIAFQLVTSNEEIDEKVDFVYDIEVPETNNFIANGLLSHNSRWRTHGPISEINTHPIKTNKILVVHNGIIENAGILKKAFKLKLETETDTEVISSLINYFYLKGFDLPEAVRLTSYQLKGDFSFVATDEVNLVGFRRNTPLVIGKKNGFFLSSDVQSILLFTNLISFIPNESIVTIKNNGFKENITINGKKPEFEVITDKPEKLELDNYLIKEILDQVKVTKQINGLDLKPIKEKRICLIGCGSSYHAALFGEKLFRYSGIDANASQASEFIPMDEFVIALTQSGETLDVIKAIKKVNPNKVLVITNNSMSELARNYPNIYTEVGIEKSVAATKTFFSQLAVLTVLSGRDLKPELFKLISKTTRTLITKTAKKIISINKDPIVIGNGLSFPLALEAALKIKEVSYIHSEGFSGNELKHGPIALIEANTPVIVLESNINSNINEVKSRGAFVIYIGTKKTGLEDVFIKVNDTITQIIPLQLLAYELGVLKGIKVDKPRNLAKTVTV